ncbi:hypothetical protein BUALT_Bualt16G0129400 [Buddleja alternifolia]|uniref:DUF6821 domain-containing protein n=1 Tax=Buddleja alternifolia TaxID=168488 RepID=A0AAV6WJI0_9LAMI|nr:hypothetical protein BUALT_Bualt16G0129400 [Buddleja alternifolia]
MKSLSQMDLEDWEILPDDGFLEIHDDGGNKIYSRKHHHPSSSNSCVFQMNYFIVPPKSTHPQFVDTTKVPNHLVPVPFDLQPPPPVVVDDSQEHEEVVKKESKKNTPVEITMIMPPEKIKSFEEDQDPVSQVFFKKMKETEFVDMKVESPKSSSRGGIMTQIEGGSAGAFQFEENGDPCKDDDDSEMEMKKKNNVELELEEERDDEGGLNIWKWSLSGVGAICSFGVAAAATVCIIVLSTHQKMNKHPRRHNQKQLQFQIYSNDKRMKQVVVQHANKLNEAISAARGAAINRARITVGGYYDASL